MWTSEVEPSEYPEEMYNRSQHCRPTVNDYHYQKFNFIVRIRLLKLIYQLSTGTIEAEVNLLTPTKFKIIKEKWIENIQKGIETRKSLMGMGKMK